MKFKAAVFRGANKPLEIEEVGLTSLDYGQVLVEVVQSGLCGAQLQEIRGEKNPDMFPRLMGHEGVGIVLEVGPGVKKVSPGDQVVLHWRQGSGIESSFPIYDFNGKKATSGLITTFSEKTVISENRLTPVPTGTPFELCALLGCGLSTALSTINNKANLKFGESVLILGCGGVGLSLVMSARLMGAGEIVGVDAIDKRELLNPFNAEYFSEVERKFDVIIDTTGNIDLIKKYVNQLSNNGRFIMVGQPKLWKNLDLPSKVFFNGDGLSFSATQAGGFNPDIHIQKYINLYDYSKIDLTSVITDIFKLDYINAAFDCLKSGKAGRILIDI